MSAGKEIAIRLDWLQGTFKMDRWEDVWKLLGAWGLVFFDAPAGRYGYKQCRTSLGGVYVCFSGMPGFEDRPEFCVGVPGKFLKQLDGDRLFEFFSCLMAAGMRVSRLDVCADDFEKIVSPEDVYRTACEGDVQGYRNFELIQSRSGKGNGSTCYLGKRGKLGGGRQIAVYDKGVESGGEVNAIRWEVRYFKDFARAAAAILEDASDVAHFMSRLSGLVGSAVSFPMRKGGAVAADRAQQHPFWAALVAALGRCVVKVQVVPATWEVFVQRVRPRLRIALAVLRQGLGDEATFRQFVDDELLIPGEARMTPFHRALAAEGAAAGSYPDEDIEVL